MNIINKVSKQLIEEKRGALLVGDNSSRDVMSVLGKPLSDLSVFSLSRFIQSVQTRLRIPGRSSPTKK